jgi:uncharacterized repeat protein (TIGR03803 family)
MSSANPRWPEGSAKAPVARQDSAATQHATGLRDQCKAQTYTVLRSFAMTDGADSWVSLTQASDGNLYGTMYVGGVYNFGTVFKMNAAGNLTMSHSSTGGTDGAYPRASVIQASDGLRRRG